MQYLSFFHYALSTFQKINKNLFYMNVINLITSTYGKLHNYPGVPFWLLTPFRKIVREIANIILPLYLKRTHEQNKISGKEIIISFTSFPARINEVWKVVESLKRQSVRPGKIILWLSNEQFPNTNDIPKSLLECVDDLFEIRMVDDDMRSHKKYYYAMQTFSQKAIVTCDDDVYYHKDMLRNLVSASHHFPHCIIANTTKQILYDKNGILKPYAEWNEFAEPYARENRVQIGEGGVLYPPDCLQKLVFRKDLISNLAPLADDLWLNMIARLSKTPIVQSGQIILPLPIACDAPTLTSVNNGSNNMNDVQINNMRQWLTSNGMPDVYSNDYKD